MTLARRLAALSPVALLACGSKPTDTRDSAAEEPPTVDELVCLQTSEGGIEMTPGPAAASTAPAMLEINVPYTIVLNAQRGGWIRVPLTAGEYQLWIGADEVISGMVFGTTPAAPPEPTPNSACPTEIPAQFTFTVAQDQDVFFSVKPSITPRAWVMITEVDSFGQAAGATGG